MNPEIKMLRRNIQGRDRDIAKLKSSENPTNIQKKIIRWLEAGNQVDQERIKEIKFDISSMDTGNGI